MASHSSSSRPTDTKEQAHALASLRQLSTSQAEFDELKAAVNLALDLGLSWQAIAKALGVRRGAAYQRFRRRPNPTTNTDRPPL